MPPPTEGIMFSGCLRYELHTSYFIVTVYHHRKMIWLVFVVCRSKVKDHSRWLICNYRLYHDISRIIPSTSWTDIRAKAYRDLCSPICLVSLSIFPTICVIHILNLFACTHVMYPLNTCWILLTFICIRTPFKQYLVSESYHITCEMFSYWLYDICYDTSYQHTNPVHARIITISKYSTNVV